MIIGVGMVSISIYAVDVGAAEVLGVMTRTVGFQSCPLVCRLGRWSCTLRGHRATRELRDDGRSDHTFL